jgi:hypothetical protein
MDDSWGSDMARWIQFHRRALVGASGALAVAGFVAMSEIDRIVSGGTLRSLKSPGSLHHVFASWAMATLISASRRTTPESVKLPSRYVRSVVDLPFGRGIW